MGDINIKQPESLRWRMRVIETLTVIGTAWIALAVYEKKEEAGLLFGGSRSPSIPVKVLYAIPSAKKTVRL